MCRSGEKARRCPGCVSAVPSGRAANRGRALLRKARALLGRVFGSSGRRDAELLVVPSAERVSAFVAGRVRELPLGVSASDESDAGVEAVGGGTAGVPARRVVVTGPGVDSPVEVVRSENGAVFIGTAGGGGVPSKVPLDQIPSGPFTLPNGATVERFFHGTVARLEPGDVIGPGFETNYDATEFGYAYAATELRSSASYAVDAWAGDKWGRRPRAYAVVPLSVFEEDPEFDADGNDRGRFDGDMRSRVGWVVVAEVTDEADFSEWESEVDWSEYDDGAGDGLVASRFGGLVQAADG